MMPTSGKSSRGFTLIELLVVIGLMAILVGILVPALRGAKDNALRLECLNNLHQMSVASFMYQSSNDGSYPLAFDYGASTLWFEEWDFSTDYQGATRPGLLWDYHPHPDIPVCPSVKWANADSSTGIRGSTPQSGTGYNYNVTAIGGYRLLGRNTFTSSARMEDIRRPSQTSVFGDGHGTGGPNKFMYGPEADSEHNPSTITQRIAGTQGYRHVGETNMVFADGHGESLPDRYDANLPGVVLETGFVSLTNSLYDLD